VQSFLLGAAGCSITLVICGPRIMIGSHFSEIPGLGYGYTFTATGF